MAVGTIQPIALSHLAQACLSLVISRRSHSALYRCLAHNFLPEVSTARSLACKSYLSALGAGLEGHCEREDHPLPNRCYAELNSSLMVQGLRLPLGAPQRRLHKKGGTSPACPWARNRQTIERNEVSR